MDFPGAITDLLNGDYAIAIVATGFSHDTAFVEFRESSFQQLERLWIG
jgi:hypothetical protein